MPQGGFEPTVPVFEHIIAWPRARCGRHCLYLFLYLNTRPMPKQRQVGIRLHLLVGNYPDPPWRPVRFWHLALEWSCQGSKCRKVHVIWSVLGPTARFQRNCLLWCKIQCFHKFCSEAREHRGHSTAVVTNPTAAGPYILIGIILYMIVRYMIFLSASVV
jgi:hypothetical protein